MARRLMTAAQRHAVSARMKRAWKTRRLRNAKAQRIDHTVVVEPSGNGTRVEYRIQLYIHDHEVALSVEDARQLRDMLSQALPTP